MDQRDIQNVVWNVLNDLAGRGYISGRDVKTVYNRPDMHDTAWTVANQCGARDSNELYNVMHNWLLTYIDDLRRRSQHNQGYSQPPPAMPYGGGPPQPDASRMDFSSAAMSSSTSVRVPQTRRSQPSIPPPTEIEMPTTTEVPAGTNSSVIEGSGERSVKPIEGMAYQPGDNHTRFNLDLKYRSCPCICENITDDEVIYDRVGYEFSQVGKMRDGAAHPITVFKVANSLPEHSIRTCIDNLMNHMSRFADGRFIGIIDTTIYSIEREPIPLDSSALLIDELLKPNKELTTNVADLSRFFKEIENGGSFPKSRVNTFLDLININLERYCRVPGTTTIANFSDLGDIIKTVDSAKRGKVQFPEMGNPEFPITVVKCIEKAIKSIVTKFAKNGVVDFEGEIADVITHPKFVIRENELTDRDPDLQSPEKLPLIGKYLSVYPQQYKLCYANFIPEGLEADLNKYEYITLDCAGYSQIDWIMNEFSLFNTPMDIVCEADGKVLTYRNGMDFGGNGVLFKSDLDITK